MDQAVTHTLPPMAKVPFYKVLYIQVLFAHNDDMAIGAIQAIQEIGKKPGKDIVVVSIDGIKDALQALIDGKSNAVIECNPLLGPQAFDAVKKIIAKQRPDGSWRLPGSFWNWAWLYATRHSRILLFNSKRLWNSSFRILA